MIVSLTVSVFLPSVIFLAIFYYWFQITGNRDHVVSNLITGAAAWSIVAIITYLPYRILIDKSTISAYIEVLDVNDLDMRTHTFWILLIGVAVSEVVRRLTILDTRFSDQNYLGTILYGLGWAIGEFCTRYIFFFDNNPSNEILYLIILFVYVFVINSSLAILHLRDNQNTKFVMYAIFLNFFVQMAIFGAFGYNLPLTEVFQKIGAIILLQTILIGLSIYVKPEKIHWSSNTSDLPQ
ncbi:MAG: hypothetical protein ACXADH_02590 [Candidatus Kariarchaeaceae archaeon]|jgi:hypothetical protein